MIQYTIFRKEGAACHGFFGVYRAGAGAGRRNLSIDPLSARAPEGTVPHGSAARQRLYKDIYPLILRAAARDLDQVRIERDRITFTLVCPPGTLGVFELCQCGHRQMSRTRTRVLAEVIAEDIEILRDRGKYGLSRYRITRANGSVDYGYVYTIRTPYKDAVMEARRRISMRIGI